MSQQIPLLPTHTPQFYSHFHHQAKIVLHHGKALDFIQTIPPKTIQLIISSPPYNLNKDYETQLKIEKYLKIQQLLIQEMPRILHDQGSICWQVGNYVQNGEVFPLDIYYYQLFKKCQFKLRNRIIWHFGHGLHASKRFSGRYETILWFSKDHSYTFNLDKVRIPSKYPKKRHYKGKNKGMLSGHPFGKNPSDFWEILQNDWEYPVWNIPNVKSNHPEKTIHPCQFPVELAERCVLAFTNPQEYVFDPYCGVGSSLIATLKNQRKAIGVDQEKKYCDITKHRIQKLFQGTLKMRPLGKPIYKPKPHPQTPKTSTKSLYPNLKNLDS